MTEREKMLAGMLYDCADAELLTQWHKAKDLIRDYNRTDSADATEKERILGALLGRKGKNLWITAPFYVDYGNQIYFGNNCEVNMNCTFLDDNVIRIGDNALIAPNVQIYTAFHECGRPIRSAEGRRLLRILQNPDGARYHWRQCMDWRRCDHSAGGHDWKQCCDRCRKRCYKRYTG